MADVLLANCNTTIRFVPASNGHFKLCSTTQVEREVMEDDRAAAIARLAIDKAMQE